MDIDFNLRIFSFHRKITIGKQWVRFAIIVMVTFISTVASFWGSRTLLLLLLVAVLGIAGALMLLKQPRWAFIVIYLSGIFIPITGPGGTNAAVVAVGLLIFLWLSDMMVVKRRFHFVNSRVLLPVILLMVISVTAFAMGQIPWFVFANQAPLAAQAGGFAIFMLSLLCMVATANLLKDLKWIQIIVWTFIGLGGLYVFGRFLKLPVDRFYNWAYTSESMFWTWLVALAFAQAMLNSTLKKSIRGLLFIIVFIAMYVAIVQAYDWKSGWVPPLVAIGAILALRYRQLIAFAVPFALIAVVYLAGKLITSDAYSWGTRVDAWIIVLTISQVSPLLGMGFANYYWYTPLFPIRGFKVSFNSHSQYVDLVAQVGILGLLAFLWIFFEMGLLTWKLSEKLPDGFMHAYAYGVFGGVAGTLIAAFLVDWVLPFTYNIGYHGFRASILTWIFMGAMVSVEQIYLTKSNSK